MKTHSPITSRRGILVGRPLAAAMLAAWLLALTGFVHLLRQNQHLANLVQQQQAELGKQKEQVLALQQRLRVLEAIEDIQSSLTPDEEVHLAHQVYNNSKKHNLDPLLVLALIRVESGFAPKAVSSMGALGLMQVMPATARFVSQRRGWEFPGDDRLFETSYNVRLATDYLAELIGKFASVEEALIAYNCGEGFVLNSKATGYPMPVGFAKRVLKVYEFLQDHHGQSAPPLEPLAVPD